MLPARSFRRYSIGLVPAVAAVLTGCEGPQSALDPGGPDAARIGDLWWLLFWMGAGAWGITMAALMLALARPREEDRRPSPRFLKGLVIVGGGVFPAAVVVGLLFVSLDVSRGFAVSAAEPRVVIRVTGHQWWWQASYVRPGASGPVETANEIRIPAGEPVRFLLESGDVIHSFWVPSLGGKLDMVPGKTNVLDLQASAPGVFRGQCAEFCGRQHTHMAFQVVALEPGRFDAWLEAEARPASEPEDGLARRGREVFAGSRCAECHAIRGVSEARRQPGPDLTHFAGRRTLTAALLPNTRGHLGGWIANPQALKPGTKMAQVPLSAEEFIALLRYLEGLK